MGTELAKMTAVIEKGIAEGLHLGAQVYVSVDGKTLADTGVGESEAGNAHDDRPDDHLVLDDQTDGRGVDRAAVGARPDRARRSGRALRPRVRSQREGPDHDPPPPDAHRRTPRRGSGHQPGHRPGRLVGRSGRRHLRGRTGRRLGAGQEGGLPPHVRDDDARRDHPARRRPAVQRVRPPRSLRTTRHDGLLGRHADREGQRLRRGRPARNYAQHRVARQRRDPP